MLTDYHVHLRPDDVKATAAEHFTSGNVQRYLDAAENAGVGDLGVSEHIHRFHQAQAVWDHEYWRTEGIDDLDAHVEFVRSQTPLKLGIEMDFIAGREDRTANLLEGYEWDYVIGSVHFVRNAAIDWLVYDIWDEITDPDKVWQLYFEAVAESARSGLFDIIAHPDLVKIWGDQRPLPRRDRQFYYEIAVEAFVEAGVTVEVSTAGLRKPVGEIYPAPEFLAMCASAGLSFALSSDAHTPDQVGFEYDEAVALLNAHGIDQIATFAGRERKLEPVG